MKQKTCLSLLCLLNLLCFRLLSALMLPVCHENMIKGEYYIPKPTQCIRHQTTSIVNCSADVYYPSANFQKITITSCEMYETTAETTFYFFGAKVNNNHTKPLHPPSVATCSDWARSMQSNCCGHLAKLSENSWATTNTPEVTYVWPTTHRETVRNAVLLHSTGIYDHLKKQLSSPLNSLSNCNIKKGSCITGNRVHIWNVPNKLDCPRVKKIKKVHNVTLHLDNSKAVYRAEIKPLGISLHSQTTCPHSVHTCFPHNSVCDPSGLVLVPHNCSDLTHLSLSKASFSSQSKLPYIRFLRESNDVIKETIDHLNSELHYQECQLQNLFTTLYSILGRQYPGQVLSSLLHKPAAGVTVGDIITEISCQETNVTLLPSLQYGKHFSSRPLVQLDASNGTGRIGQILRDGNVYIGVRLIENYTPGRVFTFLINDKFYTFQNYTLTHADASIYPLAPTLAPINARYDIIDFQSLTHFFPSSNLGFEDVNSLLQTISETNMMRDQLTTLFQTSDSSSTSYQPSYVLDTTTSALKNVFLQMMSSITNPIISSILTIIFLLSLIWAVILTAWTLRILVPYVIFSLRNKTKPMDSSSNRTPDV